MWSEAIEYKWLFSCDILQWGPVILWLHVTYFDSTAVTGIEQGPGPWINIKMSSSQYRKSHCGAKTVIRSSKITSLYWIGPQILSFLKLPHIVINISTSMILTMVHQVILWYENVGFTVVKLCVSKMDYLWFRQWLGACLALSHHMNKCRLIINWALRKKHFNKK